MNASNSRHDEMSPCDYCGTPVPDLWFGLEVQRPRPTTDGLASIRGFDWVDVIFCSQEHGALWLQAPLPALEPVAPDRKDPGRGSRRHRLFAPLLVGGVLVVAALAVVGLTTVVRWFLAR